MKFKRPEFRKQIKIKTDFTRDLRFAIAFHILGKRRDAQIVTPTSKYFYDY